MSHILGCIDGKYFEWSTIVDAPTFYDATIEELLEYIKDEYGNEGCRNLSSRLRRVETTGLSTPYGHQKHILADMRKWLEENAAP